ncbi:MAG: long-chain-acyl-CoA synthetase [Deltaproteobacteria bacterium]|nr:long-chain-acyl-CoA synthetase [Deltaproteobacteria bacterium]
MGRLERLAIGAQEIRAAGRLLGTLPKVLPNAKWSTARLLDERVRRAPEDAALLYLERRYTWRELDAEVDRWAHALRAAEIGRGDGVPLLMDNRPEFLFAMTALSRIGAVAALINTGIAGPALAHAIRVSGPKRMIVGTEHAAKVRALFEGQTDFDSLGQQDILEQRDAEFPDSANFASMDALLEVQPNGRPSGLPDPLASECGSYIYTSGTTGMPKAAIITNSRFIMAGAAFAKLITDMKPSDVLYMTLPLYHSTGMFAGWSCVLQSGACMALQRKFSASRCWDDIERYEATIFVYIGELCRYLLHQEERPSETRHRLRLAMGNGLRPDIWEEFQNRFGIPSIREFYGATEGNSVLVNVTGERGKIGRLRAGLAILDCDAETGEVIRNAEGRCECVEEGEKGLLVARINAALRFDGYVDREASEKKILHGVFNEGDTFFNTGDLVGLGENGWISFADRVGDTFRWKGENVSTNEVAEILNRAPGVLESNVYGVRVPGADGRAGMASLNCDDTFSIDGFATFVVEELPGFQRPYFVRLQRDMRITGTFKHQKFDYRREAFDLSQVDDPLYLLDDGKYVQLDRTLYEALMSGEKVLR